MSSESSQPPPRARLKNMATRPSEPEYLPCPRCHSNNTKFCYYNNYNLSQPRHFCKSCHRYWTRGGTLRNVPVGGGTRKSNATKRSRSSPINTTATTSSSSSSTVTYDPIPANLVSAVIPKIKPEIGFVSSHGGAFNLNETVAEGFTSLVPLSGFGLGLHSGFTGMGFGLGTWDWPLEQVGEGNGCGNVSGAASGCNTWQIGGVDGGLSDGDGCLLPDLAISAPGKGL